MACFLGVDTSNYTTSLACFDAGSDRWFHCAQLLPVMEGMLGLRQSDAVFAHLKAIPVLFHKLSEQIPEDISAIAVSVKPRPCEDSYMPCFVSGTAVAQAIASVLRVPCYQTSHQEGHLAAVLAAAKRYDLFQTRFLAWHLSGGTTELLLVTPKQSEFQIQKIGGTTDISAGQLIDRTGQKLSLAFPSGKALDLLAQTSVSTDCFHPRVNEGSFSLSGVENKVQNLIESGASQADIARYVLLTISAAIQKVSINAKKRFGDLPLVFSGGVASNSILRMTMQACDAVFASPEFSTDNALGCAVLAARRYEGDPA